MSNLYGYSDYNGPQEFTNEDSTTTTTAATVAAIAAAAANDGDDEDESDGENDNPLQVGFWMEGDSLAPPCGSSISTIHQILDFASVTADDVLYDLGCGDGRVCLEAYAQRHCRTTIGIEVEEDLVERAQELIGRLPKLSTNKEGEQRQPDMPRVIQADLRVVLDTLLETARQNRGGEDSIGNVPNTSTTIDSMEQQQLPLPTVIILYLLPEALAELAPRFEGLLEASCGTLRIVCNTWAFPKWRPTLRTEIAEREASSSGDGGGNNIVTTSLFLYTSESLVSAEKANGGSSEQ
jgi:SAM-dependent methyltransferase